MKLKKLISVFAAVAMLSSAFATIASADATIEWGADDGVYFITDAYKVTERTPYIEIAQVKQMKGDEVAALGTAKTSSLSALKLKNDAGKYGDTTKYTMYQVDGIFKNVGDLVKGYDADGNESKIQLMRLDASIDISSVADKIVDCGYSKATDPTTGIAWSGGWDKSTNVLTIGNQLGTDNAIPKEDTVEGGIINEDYAFTAYFVVNAGTAEMSIPFSTAAAGVQYLANADMKEVKIPATSFTLKEASAGPTFTDDTQTTMAKDAEKVNADGTYNVGVKADAIVVPAGSTATKIKFGFTTNDATALRTTASYPVTLPTAVQSGSVSVALNVWGVPNGVTLTYTGATVE